MQVIDILVNMADKEEGNFKFWVWFNGTKADEKNAAHWEYKNGYVRQYDNPEGDDFFWFINEGIYDLNDEIMIIEDKSKEEEIKELPPLEYIKMSLDNKTMSYGSEAVFYTLDSKFLALIINRVIREVEDLKHRLEVTDKELEDHKKDLLSHNGSSIKLATGLDDGGVRIGTPADLGLKEAEALELVNKIIDF